MLKHLFRHRWLIVIMLVITFGIGCQTEAPRVVLVPPVVTNPDTLVPTDLIKIGPKTYGRIYVYSREGWVLSNNEIEIPEGWYCMPPPAQEK